MIIRLPETDSTNNYLRKLCNNETPEEGTVVWAEYQNAGKGQRGNSWESEAGENITFSLLLFPEQIPAHHQFVLSQIISLGIIDILKRFDTNFSIKWPNDIYWKDRKIAGILIENDLTGNMISQSITGIGINVNQKRFKSDAPNPVSLFQITGERYDREGLLADILDAIAQRYFSYSDSERITLNQEYLSSLYRNEGYHDFISETKKFKARIAGVDENGHILLETSRGEIQAYAFKEVAYVL
ncbi:biotin--[acetyl-CoA-carboxylase] ligase [Coprobacter tertius]|uniref:Biotin--[acetyl-CoA-carboxylase] ligase n=1 Tax=Coprobacter tertius TaxID=2944915 RepID=A0ABT1MLI0_9BACT|nr:biotin--[acetyl-CoA-carboxylase] ligase [Coprobacter tertius]MCP9612746.1 biotin--[acetyl-CoA-carboxylase] ligase [Coprobacter tertius]